MIPLACASLALLLDVFSIGALLAARRVAKDAERELALEQRFWRVENPVKELLRRHSAKHPSGKGDA